MPATDKAVRFQNVSTAKLEEGKVVQYNSETGWLEILAQARVLPLRK